MKLVVGVFKSRFGAERAAAELVPLGVPKDRVNILTPDVTPQRSLRSFPHQQPSRPAWVRPSAQLSAALSAWPPPELGSLFVPGVGPVLAIGLAGGILGAAGGGAAGGALESSTTEGLPEDELYV